MLVELSWESIQHAQMDGLWRSLRHMTCFRSKQFSHTRLVVSERLAKADLGVQAVNSQLTF